MKRIWYLVLVVCMTMLLGTAAYAGTDHDPAIDVLSTVFDVGLPADVTTDSDSDISAYKIDTQYFPVTSTGPAERYSAFSHFSKSVALPEIVAPLSFRLNLKIPWQYWQA